MDANDELLHCPVLRVVIRGDDDFGTSNVGGA